MQPLKGKQMEESVQNKSLQEIIKNYPFFIQEITQSLQKLQPRKPFLEAEEKKMVEGSDISVCVRVRPLLSHEVQNQHFQCVFGHNPRVLMFQPKFDVKKSPKVEQSVFDLDHAFSQLDDNDAVYKATALPLVDLGLNGGVSSLFAYGQTGSGKTFTVSGVMDRIASDLFARQQPHHFDEHKQPLLQIYASFFELLGNDASDLLSPENRVDVMEDKFGKIQFANLQEVPISSPELFIKAVGHAFEHRTTQATFKNETSSRSHAICKIRVHNSRLQEAEDGEIYLIDLAGSENSKDAQFHDKQLIQQTQCINKSLMALKECIRNRALAAQNLSQFIHVPYRQSKLTLILKDAFEMESRRLSKTVVFANVSPSCADVAQTINTLRYAAAIKTAPPSKQDQPSLAKVDPLNPATWTNKELRQWITDKGMGKVDANTFCPFESGVQILRVPETDLLTRLMLNPGMTEKRAKMIYIKLWQLLIDARTQERKKKLEKKDKRSQQEKDDEQARELLERMQSDSKGKSQQQMEEERQQEFAKFVKQNPKQQQKK